MARRFSFGEQSDDSDVGSALLGSCVVGSLVLLASIDAGFPRTLWPAVGMFLVLLGVVMVVSAPGTLLRAPRSTLVAVAGLYAFALWCLVSVAWADARADAWDAGNRTLLYATLYAVVALWPWRPEVAIGTLLTFSVAVALVGAATLRAAVRAADVTDFFLDGVLAEPSGYHNANAALFLIAFWPALLFAARAETPFSIRPLLLATACALLLLAMLSQSRGSLLAFPVSAVVVLALFPGRLRLIVAAVPVALAAIFARRSLFDVFAAGGGADESAAVGAAANAFAVSVAAVAVAGIALAIADRRVTISAQVRRLAERSLVVAATVVVVVGAAFFAATDPVDRARAAWDDFKQYRPAQQTQAETHFGTGLGSNRYDFWRVALSEFKAEPVSGIGADNFAVPYLQDRKTEEEPLYPHSLVLGVLSQTGLIGFALLLVFAVAAGRAAWRARDGDAPTRTLAAAGLGVASYFVVHSAGEWLWEIPGVACPVLVALALPAGVARAPAQPHSGRRPVLVLAGLAGVGVLALASLALPLSAERLARDAAHSWRVDPKQAYSRLALARRLNPISERPDLTTSAIASRRGQWLLMQAAARRALERKPKSWYAELQLALAEAAGGRPEAAELHLARAAVLNPREPAIDFVRRRLASGGKVNPIEVDELFLRRVAERRR